MAVHEIRVRLVLSDDVKVIKGICEDANELVALIPESESFEAEQICGRLGERLKGLIRAET